jgi:hypothetical protein
MPKPADLKTKKHAATMLNKVRKAVKKKLDTLKEPLTPDLKRLTAEETLKELHLTIDQVSVLDEIAAGRPMRNAIAVLKAMEMKLAYTLEKPAEKVSAQVEHSGGVEITINKVSAPPAKGQSSATSPIEATPLGFPKP